MAWIALLVILFMALGLRARGPRGSTHLIILAAAALTLGIILLQPISTP